MSELSWPPRWGPGAAESVFWRNKDCSASPKLTCVLVSQPPLCHLCGRNPPGTASSLDRSRATSFSSIEHLGRVLTLHSAAVESTCERSHESAHIRATANSLHPGVSIGWVEQTYTQFATPGLVEQTCDLLYSFRFQSQAAVKIAPDGKIIIAIWLRTPPRVE